MLEEIASLFLPLLGCTHGRLTHSLGRVSRLRSLLLSLVLSCAALGRKHTRFSSKKVDLNPARF